MNLKLAYLYPKLLNIYGDRGNILALQQRCLWRGIGLEIIDIDPSDQSHSFADFDLFFIGGGQDSQQEIVAKDLESRKREFLDLVEDNAVILAICGGYQMLGNYYQAFGSDIPGLGILDLHTKAPKIEKGVHERNNASTIQERLIGNVVAEIQFEQELPSSSGLELNTLVGFENHSGRTYLDSGTKTKPSARIIRGHGNNGEDSTEGANYKNVFGTYLHGSLLPKNPHFTDELIFRALKRKYSEPETLTKLDDNLESAAHDFALNL